MDSAALLMFLISCNTDALISWRGNTLIPGDGLDLLRYLLLNYLLST